MTTTQYQIRPGAYYDSVTLMQLQKALAGLPDVDDAGVMMATPANCELLTESGFDLAGIDARPDDLLIMVRAASDTAAADALDQVDSLMAQRQKSSGVTGFRPRSLRGAVSQLPAAEWVLISVPGRYAAGVAGEALERGRHVFLYSDNVSAADEARLKGMAREKGLLLMGPDCGTAMINGVGLGFANRARRGSIGFVAASGTGLQAAITEVDQLGGGVSQAFGTGGRDLSAEVGGATALQALAWLAQDAATEVIVLISKPPAAEVAARLLRAALGSGKPVVVHFIGFPPPTRRVANLHFAADLTDAAHLAVQSLNLPISQSPISDPPISGHVRALFSGGTLAYEMLLGLEPVLSPLHGNLRHGGAADGRGHAVIDLGGDEFTQGRLHPMMDNDLRLRRLRQDAADTDVDLILLDVVLGEGAHPDPAGELAPAVAEAVAAGKRVVAVVVGTEGDPQGVAEQIEQLAEAGAVITRNVREALDYVYRRLPPVDNDAPLISFDTSALAAVNAGLESFHDSLLAQGATAVQMEWRPPAGGDEGLMALLERLK